MFSVNVFCAKRDFPPKNGPVPLHAVNAYVAAQNMPTPRETRCGSRKNSEKISVWVLVKVIAIARLSLIASVGKLPN